jgi:hypothetical protein
MIEVKTVLNYPRDKIYVKSLLFKQELKETSALMVKCKSFTHLLHNIPNEFKLLKLFRNNTDFVMAYNLNRYSLQIKNILKTFITSSYSIKNLVKLEKDVNVRYDLYCKNIKFWREITHDKFERLPPITAIPFKDGIFIVDGNHRSIMYFLNKNFNLKFNIVF